MPVRKYAGMAATLVLSLACLPMSAQTWDIAGLRSLARLSEEQWSAVNRGDPQISILGAQDKREIAVTGVARLRATTACFVKMLRDIENFKKSPAVLGIGKFGKPIGPQSLEGFHLEIPEPDDLRHCRLGECGVKLPVAAMQRLAQEVDWSRSDHGDILQAVVRQELVAYLTNYSNQGNPALIEYRDKGAPVRLADEFRAVLDARPGLAGLVPEFHEYLAEYPRRRLPNIDDFFYWSIENFGVKPVSSVTHVSIYAHPGRVVAASKQLYASHYFDASLGLTAALDDAGGVSGPGMYLVYLNRSRIDLLKGGIGGSRRTLMRSRLRDGMRRNMVDVVRKVESSCGYDAKAAPRGQ